MDPDTSPVQLPGTLSASVVMDFRLHCLMLVAQAIATVVVDQMGGPAPAYGALRSSWEAASISAKRKYNSYVVCCLRMTVHVNGPRPAADDVKCG